MADLLKNFVLETATAPGTSTTVNLAGAATGRMSFAAAFSSGATMYYFMDDGTQAEWGIGTFTAGSPNTLARTTVIGNTAGTTSRLNFTGTVRVYNEAPGEKTVTTDKLLSNLVGTGSLILPGGFILRWVNATGVIGTSGSLTFDAPFTTYLCGVLSTGIAGSYVARISSESASAIGYSWDNWGTTSLGSAVAMRALAVGK